MSEQKPNLVYQTNKKTGVTYVYEDYPYWNKEKAQSRSKRKCIGKLDPVTGKIIPNRRRNSEHLTIHIQIFL